MNTYATTVRAGVTTGLLLTTLLLSSGCRTQRAVNQSAAAGEAIRLHEEPAGMAGEAEAYGPMTPAERAAVEEQRERLRREIEAGEEASQEDEPWWKRMGLRGSVSFGFGTRL